MAGSRPRSTSTNSSTKAMASTVTPSAIALCGIQSGEASIAFVDEFVEVLRGRDPAASDLTAELQHTE